MIKAVLFDLDGTLYHNVKECHKAGLISAYSVIKNKISFRKFKELYEDARETVHKELSGLGVSHDRILYFGILVEKLNGKSNPSLILKLNKYYWSGYIEKIKPREGMRDVLKLLGKRFKLGLATNLVAEVQFRKLKKLKLDNIFDSVVTSEESVYDKPNPASLNMLMKRLGVKPEECLYVGDDKTDAEAGKRAGVKTAIFGNSGDIRIKTFRDILKVVEWNG